MRPGGNFGGGASKALRRPARGAVGESRLVCWETNTSRCECSGEYGGTGVKAASLPSIRQHEVSALMPCIGQSGAMPRQQAGIPAACALSRQADTGTAVHATTTASSNNAPLLPQCTVKKSPASIVSIRRRLVC